MNSAFTIVVSPSVFWAGLAERNDQKMLLANTHVLCLFTLKMYTVSHTMCKKSCLKKKLCIIVCVCNVCYVSKHTDLMIKFQRKVLMSIQLY